MMLSWCCFLSNAFMIILSILSFGFISAVCLIMDVIGLKFYPLLIGINYKDFVKFSSSGNHVSFNYTGPQLLIYLWINDRHYKLPSHVQVLRMIRCESESNKRGNEIKLLLRGFRWCQRFSQIGFNQKSPLHHLWSGLQRF